MSNLIVFEALFVFAVWMQRKGKRWKILWQAAGGQYTVGGSVRAGQPAFQYTSGNDGTVIPTTSGGPSSGSTQPSNQPPAVQPNPLPPQFGGPPNG